MGLVKGFTDIIAPQNLATNGSFRINQRGLFTDYTVVKVGDYLSDGWVTSYSTVDYVECRNLTAGLFPVSALQFRGHGKRGQIFNFVGKDTTPLSTPTTDRTYLTSKIFGGVASNSVPINLYTTPRLHIGNYASIYDYSPVLSRKNPEGTAVRITSNVTGVFSQGEDIRFTLLADGEFDIQLSNYALFMGAYMNPPNYSVPNYADDLLRCKRYYQKGQTSIRALGSSDGTYYYLHHRTMLPVEMAGTPSASLSSQHVTEEGSTTNVVANYTVYSTPGSNFLDIGATKPVAGDKPGYLSCSWELTV